jgi:hypothetical protein
MRSRSAAQKRRAGSTLRAQGLGPQVRAAGQVCAEAGARSELCQGYQGDERCAYPSAEACGTPVTRPSPRISARRPPRLTY